MALINCPECEHEVSDQAPSCPNCGVLINQQSKVTKVDLNFNKYELTNKKWKRRKMVAAPLMIIGMPMFFLNLLAAMGPKPDPSTGIWGLTGFIFSVVGFGLFLSAEVGHWWERG